MRGGGRLVNECSWTSGICFRLHHSTGKSETFSHRHPSSASLAGSEVPSSLAAFPRGKPRGRNHKQFTTNAPRCPGSSGSASCRPLQGSVQNRVCIPSNEAHPPQIRCALQHPRGGAEGTSCQRAVNVKYEQKMTFFRQITPGGIC